MIDTVEAARRRALKEAEASMRLEGMVLDESDRAMLEPFVKNEMSIEECIARIRARHGVSRQE